MDQVTWVMQAGAARSRRASARPRPVWCARRAEEAAVTEDSE